MAHGLGSSTACAVLVPPPGIKPGIACIEGGILTPGPPRKSLFSPARELQDRAMAKTQFHSQGFKLVCGLGITSPLCASVSPSVKWGFRGGCLVGL